MNKTSLKGIVSLLLIFCGAAFAVSGFLPRRSGSNYDLTAFGRLPVQFGTRVLPIDSVARNTLRLFSERTAVHLPKPGAPDETISIPALQWFLDVAFRPEVAERTPVFRITSDEVLGVIGQQQKGSQLFSFRDLSPYFDKIQESAAKADEKTKNEEKLSLFDSEISRLRDNLVLFQRLTMSFVPPGDTPAKDLALWQAILKPGSDAVLAKDDNKPYDTKAAEDFSLFARRFMDLSNAAIVGIVPSADPANPKWADLGDAGLAALKPYQVSPILMDYADMAEALRADDAPAFNTAVSSLQHQLSNPALDPKLHFESFLNSAEPFFRGALLYMLAFMCACVSWIAWGPELRRTALWLVVFGLALQTLGLYARVYLTGFGVVTSLYSAMLFNGWIGVVAGLVIELWKRNSIGAAVSAFVGFATLVVAHSLPFNGDDLELPRAVLATNFWLWTHVTCINIGCGGMFVAGALGAGYILTSAFGKLEAATARQFSQLVYGVTCFATLFSFVGTMLGGIWADQSWGRFWGWDPKENGALMIVLWCAICLHARWGRIVSERTQMALAVGGNIVTAWTLFGVNLLGVGLHSYGFMQGTFLALVAFWISQFLVIALALLPVRFWQSKPAAA